MRKSIAALAIGSILVMGISSQAAEAVQASEPEGWTFEITPYAWLAGIDADVTVKGKEFTVDRKFSDIIDHVEAAASLLAIAECNHWQLFGQADYFSLSADGTRNGVHGEIESDVFILTAGAGYVFDGPIEGSKIAVLGGLRHTSLDNTVTISGSGSAEKTTDLNDAILIVRPSVPLTEKLRFNPTFNVGAGDSDLTYELQPELQYNFTDTIAGRLGYRKVYYKEDKGDDSEFKGSFNGIIIGLGVTL